MMRFVATRPFIATRSDILQVFRSKLIVESSPMRFLHMKSKSQIPTLFRKGESSCKDMKLARPTTLNIDEFLVEQSNAHFVNFGVGLYPMSFALVFLIYGGFDEHSTRCQRPLKPRDTNVASHKAGLFSRPSLLVFLLSSGFHHHVLTLLLLHGSASTYHSRLHCFKPFFSFCCAGRILPRSQFKTPTQSRLSRWLTPIVQILPIIQFPQIIQLQKGQQKSPNALAPMNLIWSVHRMRRGQVHHLLSVHPMRSPLGRIHHLLKLDARPLYRVLSQTGPSTGPTRLRNRNGRGEFSPEYLEGA